jgi:hypothetical protein
LRFKGELRKFCLFTLLILVILVTNCLPEFPVYALSYTVDAPDDFSFAITAISGGNSGYKVITFSTDDGTMTSVKIEVSADHGGFLTSSVPTSLNAALQISGSGLTTTTLNGTNQTIIEALELLGTGPKTASVNDMVITQPSFTPVASGSYSATITFTVTFN